MPPKAGKSFGSRRSPQRVTLSCQPTSALSDICQLVSTPDEQDPVDRATPLTERIEAIEGFADMAERMLAVGNLKWADVDADYRLLAINSALRRQLESIRAAVLLGRHGLGHLAVALVRASLEDVLYLGFFVRLDRADSQKLFKVLGNWDGLRSLLAQRGYVGDQVMARLWYPAGFLDAAVDAHEKTKIELKALQTQYKWSGGILPSAAWIADETGHRKLYDYLHAAASRAVHFSAGKSSAVAGGTPGKDRYGQARVS